MRPTEIPANRIRVHATQACASANSATTADFEFLAPTSSTLIAWSSLPGPLFCSRPDLSPSARFCCWNVNLIHIRGTCADLRTAQRAG
jgi:hypothetical protein